MRRFHRARPMPEGIRVGGTEQSRRMGRWNASVLLATNSRKNKYCRISGWACRSAAFVWDSWCGIVEVAASWDVAAEEGRCGEFMGRLSFSIRAQVRYTSKSRRRIPRRRIERWRSVSVVLGPREEGRRSVRRTYHHRVLNG